MGDSNLDTLKWTNPDQGVKKMVEDTKNSEMYDVFSQIIVGPTRFWVGKTPSLIYQVWTNVPEQIIEWTNHTRSVADHNIITITVRTKGSSKTNKEILRRKCGSEQSED